MGYGDEQVVGFLGGGYGEPPVRVSDLERAAARRISDRRGMVDGVITRADVEAAAVRIAGRVLHTPMVEVAPGLWFKCEFMQHTGTFKARGAFNRVLSAQESGELDSGVGVVAASGGNAALAVAYVAVQVGVPVTVFVPATAPAVKVAKLRALGADVRQRGDEYAVAYEAAMEHVAQTGALFCHAYDQKEMVAGAGTLGLELPSQADTVVVAVGGGGLMGGVAAAVDKQVVAVEPVNAPTLRNALESGGPVDVAVSGIAADALGARRIGAIAYEMAVKTGVQSVLVSDEDIVAARRALWDGWRIVVEHGAAAAFAALHSGAYVPQPGESLAVVLCGANTDMSDLAL